MVWRDGNHSEMVLNRVPKPVWVLLVPLVLIEAYLSLADAGIIGGANGPGLRINLIQQYSVWPALWQQEEGARLVNPGLMFRFVSYSFIHANWQHLMFAGVILLAIGKFVGDRFSSFGLVAVYFTASILGAFAYLTLIDTSGVLIGCYPGVYGLIGALTYIYWQDEAWLPFNKRLKAFRLIGLLLGFQALFAFVLGGGIASMASEVPAFIAGFAVSFVVSPGGFDRLRRNFRQR